MVAHACNPSTWEAETGLRFETRLSYLARPCFRIKKNRPVWWCTLVIPVLGRLRQEDRRFEASLDNLVRPSAV